MEWILQLGEEKVNPPRGIEFRFCSDISVDFLLLESKQVSFVEVFRDGSRVVVIRYSKRGTTSIVSSKVMAVSKPSKPQHGISSNGSHLHRHRQAADAGTVPGHLPPGA